MKKINDYRKEFDSRWTPEPFSGCWLWTGSINPMGYGEVNWSGRVATSNKLSWEFYRGPIPKGSYVCHKCDVRSCVNPDHLFLGTHADNQRDMYLKSRHAWGERHGGHKLSTEDVIAIRSDPRVQREIAADYGIVQQHVSRIKLRIDRFRE